MEHNVIALDDVRAADTPAVGGKAARLGELAGRGFPVPPGFVISAAACRRCFDDLRLDDERRAVEGAAGAVLAARCAALQQRIIAAPVPSALVEAVEQAHRRIAAERPGDDLRYAVRSSATAEDLAGASFAGQHRTYYYVRPTQLTEVIRRCWASLWSGEAVVYRSTHGIAHESVYMAVIVQELVESDVSGVTFTANPISGDRDEVVVEASWGMGAGLVDGRVTPDRYIVARDGLGLRERRIAEKRFMVLPRLSGAFDPRLDTVSLERQRRETLSDRDLRDVLEWSLRCEELFGAPQDVEWAMAGGRFHLLQSRPVTAMGRTEIGREVKGKWVLFKALAENFTDPLTPLAVDLLSSSAPPGIRFIGGRAYLSLDLIRAITPFRLSDEELADLAYLSGLPAVPRLSLPRLPAALLAFLGFQLAFGVVLARTRGLPDDCLDRYRDLCRRVDADDSIDAMGAMHRLLVSPPILDPIGHMALLVNGVSMRFMPWLGALRLMVRRWAPRAGPDAPALLCSGTEGVLSAAMGREIAALAAVARGAPAVRDMLLRHRPEDMLARLRGEPAAAGFLEHVQRFLAVHGHRGLKEFELRSPRWAEDPAPVLGMVRNHLLRDSDLAGHEERAERARIEAAGAVRRAIGALPMERATGVRWRLIQLAVRRARYYFKLRENSRFYHIMGVGAVRRKVLAVEARLLASGGLKCKDDVFFLQWPEVRALESGRLTWRDVEDRIRRRRLEHVRLAKMTPPRTIGIARRREPAEDPSATAHTLAGQGASPGRHEGRARVILDPSVDLALEPGEVLVAPYTDPAWTPLFLTAGAAVVEVGSYLSHAGTVAREFGMPCVVDVPDCTRRILTGARVRVDGDHGVVHLLSAPGDGS